MKKKIFTTLVLMLTISAFIYADLAPANSSYVERKVIIKSNAKYSNICLIAYIKGATAEGRTYEIKKDMPLPNAYKFNNVYVYAIDRSLLTKAGGILKINFTKIFPKKAPIRIIHPNGYYTDANSALKEDFIYYSISSKNITNVTLRVSRRILKWNDGSPDTVINY